MSFFLQVVLVGSVWEESHKLHEQANEYVEDFCDFLALLWRYLYAPRSSSSSSSSSSSCTGSDRLPMGILKILWENLIGGGYMVLLDGFSKVPYCSTEGRALMSMDVRSYRSGVSARSIASRIEELQDLPSSSSSSCCYPLPNNIQPYRNMAYVDTYIKIFYFPPNVSCVCLSFCLSFWLCCLLLFL